MNLLEAFVILFVGIGTGIGLVFIANDERVKIAAKKGSAMLATIMELEREKAAEKRKVQELEQTLRDLRASVTNHVDEIKLFETIYEANPVRLVSNSRVHADDAIVFGRGSEWVYVYTFPAHEALANAKNEPRFPMKVGMSTQASVIDRITQQMQGHSTAMSEKATVRLVFRVNQAAQMEKWMHNQLQRRNQRREDAVGTEWFNTNVVEIEQLFREYVLKFSTVGNRIVDA